MHRSLNRGNGLLRTASGIYGDSGYGPEGTKGQFDVHLHLESMLQSTILKRALIHTGYYDFLNIARTELL